MAAKKKKDSYGAFEWGRTGRQLISGLYEGTLANAANKDSWVPYIPALIPNVTSIPGTIKSFTGSGQKNLEGKGGKPFKGDNAVERLLNDAYTQSITAEKKGDELLGAGTPRNTAEYIARYGPLSFIKGPVGWASGAGKAGKVAKALSKLNKAPGIIRKPVKAAAEVLTPFRQTGLKTAVPLNVLGLGAGDVLKDRQQLDEEGHEYKGMIPKAVRAVTGSEEPMTEKEATQVAELDAVMMQDAYENGEATDEDVLDWQANTPTTEAQMESARDDMFWDKTKSAGTLVAGTLAALYAGGKFGKNVVAPHVAAREAAINDPNNFGKFKDPSEYGEHAPIDTEAGKPPKQPLEDVELTSTGQEPKFIGTEFETSDIGAVDKKIGSVFEATRPIVALADRAFGRNHAKKLGFKLDRLTNSSIQARFNDWVTTGRLPGTEMKTEKLAAWSRQYAKELSPEEQQRLGSALVSASSLDDFKNTGDRASLFKEIGGAPVTAAQLQMLVDNVKADPKLGKYFTQVQKFYDEKLQYEVQRGLMSPAEYAEMRKLRPNYVPLQSNLKQEAEYSPFSSRYSANKTEQAARATETHTGVPGHQGVVNPMSKLFEDFSDTIRKAETNEFRRDYLEQMAQSGLRNSKGDLVVRKLKAGASGENVHEVFTPTGIEKYDILDSQLAKSLNFSPRNAIRGLEEARQLYQNMTTGSLGTLRNLFSFAAAPIMDSMAASTLAGKSHGVGALNRMFVGGHVGGVRAAGDMILREMATKMRMRMIADNSWLRDGINSISGGKGAEAFTQMLEGMYKNSTLADMDQMGITSKAAWGAADPTHVMEGMQGAVPEYARNQAQRVIDDIDRSFGEKGGIDLMRGALLKSKNRWIQAKTLPIMRQYTGLLEAMHNGARYSAVRANKGKVKDLDEFISDMRRLSSDPAIHGSGKAAEVLTSANLFGPISLSTMAQVGKRAREDPINFLRNMTQTGGTAAAMFYLSQYYDQDARDAHNAKNSQQKASKLSLFGGAELPLDQLQRLLLATVMPITDQISGMNSGEWDDDFIGSMKRMIEGEGPARDEVSTKDSELRINEAIRANLPTSLAAMGMNYKPDGSVDWNWKPDYSSIPLAAGVLASQGVDPSMSALTGEMVGPKTQGISGFDPETDRPGSLMSATHDTMVRTLFGSAGAGLMDIGDDAYRTLNSEKPEDRKRIWDIVGDQWKEGAQKGAGIFKPLFGDRVQAKTAADTNYALLKDREKGIENALSVYTKDMRTDTFSGASTSHRSAGVARELDPSGIASRGDLDGTMAARIGTSAQQVTNELNAKKVKIKQISAQAETIKAATDKTQAEKNALLNDLTDDVKYQRMDMLRLVRRHEEHLSKILGRDFSFEDYNPEEWMEPYVKKQD